MYPIILIIRILLLLVQDLDATVADNFDQLSYLRINHFLILPDNVLDLEIKYLIFLLKKSPQEFECRALQECLPLRQLELVLLSLDAVEELLNFGVELLGNNVAELFGSFDAVDLVEFVDDG